MYVLDGSEESSSSGSEEDFVSDFQLSDSASESEELEFDEDDDNEDEDFISHRPKRLEIAKLKNTPARLRHCKAATRPVSRHQGSDLQTLL